VTPVEPPSPDEVRALAARRFGGEVRVAVRVGEGSHHIAAFDVDDRFIMRFALDDVGAECVEVERTVLPVVASRVEIDVPRIAADGERDGFPFVGYPKIRGVSGEELRPDRARWPGLADQLGRFLSSIHALPPDLSPIRRVPVGGEARWAELPALAETIERGAPDLLTDEMRRYLRGDVPAPRPPDRLTFCHADLKGEHLLMAASGWRVAGVIDWADACANDPAIDFAGLAIWLGPEFVRMVLERYVPRVADDALLERAVALARGGMLWGLGVTLRGHDDWPYVRAQLRQAFLD